MIKRLFKKASELVVKKYEYYRVAVQQEIDERQRSRQIAGPAHRGMGAAPHESMQLHEPPPSHSSQIAHDFTPHLPPHHHQPRSSAPPMPSSTSSSSSNSSSSRLKVVTEPHVLPPPPPPPPSTAAAAAHSQFVQHPSLSKPVQNHVKGKTPPPLELAPSLPQQQHYTHYTQQQQHQQQQHSYNMVNHRQKQPTAHTYNEPESSFELSQSSESRPSPSQVSRYNSLKSTCSGNGDAAAYSGTNHYHTGSSNSISSLYPPPHPTTSGRGSSLQQRMPNSDILQSLEETFV